MIFMHRIIYNGIYIILGTAKSDPLTWKFLNNTLKENMFFNIVIYNNLKNVCTQLGVGYTMGTKVTNS